MEHLFPAPEMKRKTHAHEAHRSARASHMLPGLLAFGATHGVICSSLSARGKCPHTLSPCPPDLRDHSSWLESYYMHPSLSTKGLSEAGVQLAGRTTWKREMCQMGYQGSAGLFWSPSSGWQGLRLVPLLLAKTVNPIRPVEKQSVLSCGVGVGGCCLQRRAFVYFSSLPATNSCRQMPVLVWTRDFWITLTPHGRLCWEVDLASDATAAAVCVRRDQSPFSLSWFAQLEMCNHGTST